MRNNRNSPCQPRAGLPNAATIIKIINPGADFFSQPLKSTKPVILFRRENELSWLSAVVVGFIPPGRQTLTDTLTSTVVT